MAGVPEYDFTAEDGVIHTVWVVADAKQIEEIKKEFSEVDALYIADGHHRAAAAATVARARRGQNKLTDAVNEYESVLAVFFPHTQLRVMDYNRAVKDLNGLTRKNILKRSVPALQSVKTLRQDLRSSCMISVCI